MVINTAIVALTTVDVHEYIPLVNFKVHNKHHISVGDIDVISY